MKMRRPISVNKIIYVVTKIIAVVYRVSQKSTSSRKPVIGLVIMIIRKIRKKIQVAYFLNNKPLKKSRKTTIRLELLLYVEAIFYVTSQKL